MSDQAGERAPEGQTEFELPLTTGGEKRRIRRSLFGYHADDVRSEFEARNQEIDELRRDVSALWLAFGQHERAIRDLVTTMGRISGTEIEPPGGRFDLPPGPEGTGAGAPIEPPPVDTLPIEPRPVETPALEPPPIEPPPIEPEASAEPAPISTSIGEQLNGLDQVLAAIEEATHSLERTYTEQIAEPDPEDSGRAAEQNGIRGDEGATSRA